MEKNLLTETTENFIHFYSPRASPVGGSFIKPFPHLTYFMVLSLQLTVPLVTTKVELEFF